MITATSNTLYSSKEGMETSKGELQQLYTESYNEYNQFLNNYNKELRKNMSDSI